MISDEKKEKLDGQLKFAVENMGPAYVAEQLRISLEDVEALGDWQLNWTQGLADRMSGMLEHMASLGVAPPDVPTGEPETGEDPPAAEITEETEAGVADPQALPPEEVPAGLEPTESPGASPGAQGTEAPASPPEIPPEFSFECLAQAYRAAEHGLKVRARSAEDKSDWRKVLLIIEATALRAHGRSVRVDPDTPGQATITPLQEMTRMQRLAGEFRRNANPRRADAIRAKLHSAYRGDIEHIWDI